MMEHFDIDMVLEYGTTEFPETEKVVNPSWRQLDRSRNSVQNKLRYRRARFTEMTMHPATQEDPAKYRKWVGKKSDLCEEIENYEHELAELKSQIKQIQKHIVAIQLSPCRLGPHGHA